MNIKITDIATAKPDFQLSQKKLLGMIRRKRRLSRAEDVLYKRFLLDKGIETRNFAVSRSRDLFIEDPDNLITRFQKEAARLSVSAIKKCLQRSAIHKKAIDCIIVTTCTGYLCPGLTSYIIEEAGLREDIFAVDIAGMGCGGALPAIWSAYNFLKAHKESTAIVVSTEISSAAIFWDESPGIILSNSIFADGSAVCIMTNKKGAAGFRIVDYLSKISPEHRDKLRFETKDSKLRNVISPDVPRIAGGMIKDIIKKLLKRNGLKQNDIMSWAVHPGGRKVLDSMQETMKLKDSDLNYSRDILRRYGNMSSPSALFVLGSIFRSVKTKKGDLCILTSFGAGFSGYAALLSYE